MKILILKPSSLGDVVQAIPVLRLLKKAYPQAEIYWWISAELSPLLEFDPDLDGLFLFHRRQALHPFSWPVLFRDIQEMRAIRFTHVIDLQSLARSGLIAWLAAGQMTIGLDDPREAAHGFYDISIPRPSYDTHAVDWYLEVLRVFKVTPDFNFEWLPHRPEAAARVKAAGVGEKRIILNPGARWPNKRWPTEYYRDTATLLREIYPDHQVVLLGGPGDAPLAVQVREDVPDLLDLTGRTGLWELIEVIRGASLMVSNDTGPMHIAAAVRTPLVSLFGPTEPSRTGPYGQQDSVLQVRDLPCVPCMKARCRYSRPLACLRDISPEHVLKQVEQRISHRVQLG